MLGITMVVWDRSIFLKYINKCKKSYFAYRIDSDNSACVYKFQNQIKLSQVDKQEATKFKFIVIRFIKQH